MKRCAPARLAPAPAVSLQTGPAHPAPILTGPGPAVPTLRARIHPPVQAQASPSAQQAALHAPSRPVAASLAQAAHGPAASPAQAGPMDLLRVDRLRARIMAQGLARGQSPAQATAPSGPMELEQAPVPAPVPSKRARAPAIAPLRAEGAPMLPGRPQAQAHLVQPGPSRRAPRAHPTIAPRRRGRILPPLRAPREKPVLTGSPSPGPPRAGLRPPGGSPALAALASLMAVRTPNPGRADSRSPATRASQPVLAASGRDSALAANPVERSAAKSGSSIGVAYSVDREVHATSGREAGATH